MAQVSLSASTLKLYLDCPRCFWVHLTKGLERPRGPYPSLPTGMDGVLKRYFDAYRKTGTLPPLLDGRLTGTLLTTPLSMGFTDPALHARLWGKLDDCLVLADGRHAPLDHKTRASAPADVGYTEQYYQLQMDVYSLLLEREGLPISRTAYVVYYYPLSGELHKGFPFGVTIHHITTDPEKAARVFREAARLLDGPLPKAGASCEFCRWAAARSALS